MAIIENVHRATIFYDAPVEVIDAIEEKAFDFAGDLDVETFGGCPAAGPNIVAEGASLKELTAWVAKIERYIKRRKGAELHEQQ